MSTTAETRPAEQSSDPSPARRPILGPSATGGDLRRVLRLSWMLAVADFKLRFFGSVLGYLWQLMRPLLLFGILFVVFSEFLDFGGGVPFYPVALLLGIVLFTFFSDATGGGVRALVQRENLVRKIEFPRLAVPLATVMTASLNLLLNLIPVVIFLVASGGRVRASWIQIPLILLVLLAFSLGIAMILSVLFVRYRDVEPIWDVVLQAMFYGTPIFYTGQIVAEKTSETVAELIMLNPFAAILQQARHAMIDPAHESAATAVGGAPMLLIPGAVILLTVAGGFLFFSRRAPLIAEEL
ncbi:MAG TPA: ABC transporter permease [Solirubrobacteraceae bacterium]|nr:ABC transporter permease [Solirubrobacteraceae bacterium]